MFVPAPLWPSCAHVRPSRAPEGGEPSLTSSVQLSGSRLSLASKARFRVQANRNVTARRAEPARWLVSIRWLLRKKAREREKAASVRFRDNPALRWRLYSSLEACKARSIEIAKAKADVLSWLTHLRQRRVFPKSRNGGNTSAPVDCAAFFGSCHAQFCRVPRSAVHGPVLSRTSHHLERIERAEQARARRS